jgi:hypothetical protein
MDFKSKFIRFNSFEFYLKIGNYQGIKRLPLGLSNYYLPSLNHTQFIMIDLVILIVL